jgi:3-hydroxybutyryl-CoA dehydratase
MSNCSTADNTRTLADLMGQSATITRTIGETEVHGFAGLTWDNHPNHTNEVYARDQGLPGRVAQGSLLVGLIAGASVSLLRNIGRPAVSYGYDGVRFIKPVPLGDTIQTVFEIVRYDDEQRKVWGKATLTNQKGEVVCVGINCLFVPH